MSAAATGDLRRTAHGDLRHQQMRIAAETESLDLNFYFGPVSGAVGHGIRQNSPGKDFLRRSESKSALQSFLMASIAGGIATDRESRCSGKIAITAFGITPATALYDTSAKAGDTKRRQPALIENNAKMTWGIHHSCAACMAHKGLQTDERW